MNVARIERLEKEMIDGDGSGDEYIEFRVEHYQTVLNEETGERHSVLRPASGYTEGEWHPAGPGQQWRVCYPKYENEPVN